MNKDNLPEDDNNDNDKDNNDNNEDPLSFDDIFKQDNKKPSKKNKEPEPEATELTEEQKLAVLKLWNSRPNNPPSLKELVVVAFGANFDGRDKRAKLVKAFVASKGINPPVSYIYKEKGLLDLTDEQKEIIAKNVNQYPALDISRIIFDKDLAPNSQENKTVVAYIRELNEAVKFSDRVNTETYAVPRTDGAMIKKINKYIDNPIDESQYSKNDQQKRWIKAMLNYVQSYRYIQQVNTFNKQEDRELFESSFISYTYMKDDLTPEERDQYIILCNEIVIGKNIDMRIELYQGMADQALRDAEGDTQKKFSMSMSVVETISNLRKEHNDCVKRQQSLNDDLKGKRSKRIESKVAENASLLNLVQFWRGHEKRQKLVALADTRKAKLSEEIKRLETMDSLKLEIFGIDPNEILNS